MHLFNSRMLISETKLVGWYQIISIKNWFEALQLFLYMFSFFLIYSYFFPIRLSFAFYVTFLFSILLYFPLYVTLFFYSHTIIFSFAYYSPFFLYHFYFHNIILFFICYFLFFSHTNIFSSNVTFLLSYTTFFFCFIQQYFPSYINFCFSNVTFSHKSSQSHNIKATDNKQFITLIYFATI